MALSYGILKKTSKADLVGTLVVCVPILTVMLLVSASPFATYTACKVICAFFLADFSVAEKMMGLLEWQGDSTGSLRGRQLV